MTRRASLLSAAVGLAVFAVGLYAAVPMTTLQIQVLTPGGRPVDRASVIVTFVKGRAPVKLYKREFTHWELKTNQQGLAKIPPIPQGTIKVQIIAQNYQTFGDLFDVNEAEKTLTIQLKEPQSQYSSHGENDPTKGKEK